MFEPVLKCNPVTDHLNAKNVFPLFDQQFRSNFDAFLAKSRCKIIETFKNELETYGAIISTKNNEMSNVLKEVEQREYLLKGMENLQP